MARATPRLLCGSGAMTGKEMNGTLKTLEPVVTSRGNELIQNCTGDEHDLSGKRVVRRMEFTFSDAYKRDVQLPRDKGRIVRSRHRQPRPIASGCRLTALGFLNETYQRLR